MSSEQKELSMGTDLTYNYILNKIVYVNSAKHGYSELPLKFNLAMFGANNFGKTATLTGLKLLLYPETSFVDCEKKFHFQSKNGLFSKEESYPFYFPINSSYIIMEVENKDGLFCMILYKAPGQWEYGRYFVHKSYDEIRPLFWKMSEDEMSGEFADIDQKVIDNKLKDLGAIKTTNQKEIAELIFSGYRGTKEQSRFCVVPLQDGSSSESVRAFRDIYQLSYDIDQKDDTCLPKAISTIIEMNRSRNNERLNADFNEISYKYEQLSEQGNYLQAMKNNAELWEDTLSEHNQANKLILECSSNVSNFLYIYNSKISSMTERKEIAKSDYDNASTLEYSAKKEFDDIKSRLAKAEGYISKAEGDISKLNLTIDKTSKIINHYCGTPVDEIIDMLESYLKIDKEKLSNMSDIETASNRLSSLISSKNLLVNEQENIESRLSEIDNSMLSKLDDSNANVLRTIHKSFYLIQGELSESAISSAIEFTNHFTMNESNVYFDGHELQEMKPEKYSIKEQLETFQKRLHDISIQIENSTGEIEDLKSFIDTNRSGKEVLVNSLKKDISKTEADIKLVKEFDFNKSNREVQQAELVNYKDRESSLITQREEKSSLWQDRFTEKSRCNAENQRMIGESKQLSEWKSLFSNIQNKDYIDSVPPSKDIDATQFKLNIESIEFLNSQVNAISEISVRRISKLSTLRNNVVIDDDNDTEYKAILSKDELDGVINVYRNLYAGMNEKNEIYNSEVRAHVKYVDSLVQELDDASGMLDHTVGELNNELNNASISNLEEIKLKLTLDERFLSLLETIKRYRDKSNDDSLLPQEFYHELRIFTEKFMSKKRKTLKLDMIIKGVDYHYKIKGETEYETKGQSGGTSSAITALVLSVLLKRISPSYTNVKIPIVMDEIGTLDSENTKETIEQIASKGFSVFCATPEMSAIIIKGVENHINIDRFTVDKSMCKGFSTLILPNFIEDFGKSKESKCE
jgi:hypothetical protein